MSLKRSATNLESTLARSKRQSPKRRKISLDTSNHSDSSNPSTWSVSEASALHSSPRGSRAESSDRESSVSSIDGGPVHTDEDATSESSVVSSSSEDEDESSESSEEQDAEEIVQLGTAKKPHFDYARILGDGAQDLRARLSAFLPRLAEANLHLAAGKGRENMEDVREGEQHIEMNLGLGVLEEQHSDAESDESDKTDWSAEAEDGDDRIDSPNRKDMRGQRRTDAMTQLMGRGSKAEGAGIEEVG